MEQAGSISSYAMTYIKFTYFWTCIILVVCTSVIYQHDQCSQSSIRYANAVVNISYNVLHHLIIEKNADPKYFEMIN